MYYNVKINVKWSFTLPYIFHTPWLPEHSGIYLIFKTVDNTEKPV